jgi:hypothetical protein
MKHHHTHLDSPKKFNVRLICDFFLSFFHFFFFFFFSFFPSFSIEKEIDNGSVFAICLVDDFGQHEQANKVYAVGWWLQ